MGYSDGQENGDQTCHILSQLDDFCSANNGLQDDSKSVVATGGTARMTLNAPSYPTASQTDHQGWSPTGFSGGPVIHYQGNQAVDVWSNHACSGGSVNSFLPGLRKCTPWQRRQLTSRDERESQQASFQRPPKINRLAVTGSGKEFTLGSRELLDLHFSKGQSSSQC